jgi:hypothetical protein
MLIQQFLLSFLAVYAAILAVFVDHISLSHFLRRPSQIYLTAVANIRNNLVKGQDSSIKNRVHTYGAMYQQLTRECEPFFLVNSSVRCTKCTQNICRVVEKVVPLHIFSKNNQKQITYL